jgi:arginase
MPIVLGGDCSVLLGPLVALRKRGRFGLLFLDGHADFYSPDAEPNGEVASMELAIATGRDPEVLSNIDGLRPLVREADVVAFGMRDTASAIEHGSPDVRETAIQLLELTEVRRLGLARATAVALDALTREGIDGFWIHLDADVLNDEVMPAVDYRMPDGLTPDELTTVLAAALASPRSVGLDVTIYNPRLDDEARTGGTILAKVLNSALQPIPRSRRQRRSTGSA